MSDNLFYLGGKSKSDDLDTLYKMLTDPTQRSLIEIGLTANNIANRLGPLEAISILILQAVKMTEQIASPGYKEEDVKAAIAEVVDAYYEGKHKP